MAERGSRWRDRRPGTAVVAGVSGGLCSVILLFSGAALEEPFPAAERTSEWA